MKNIIAGFHPSIDKQQLNKRGFSKDEIQITYKLSYLWFITKADNIKLSSNTTYRYILIKPTEELNTMLNIEKEIGVVFLGVL